VTNIGLAVVAIGPLIWAFGKVTLAAGAATGAVARWNAATLASVGATEAAALSTSQMAAALGVQYTAATTATTTFTGTLAGMKAALFATVGGVTALGVAVGALAFLVGVAIGDHFRPFINELLGLNEALDLVANKEADIADEMVENTEVWDNATHTLDRLKESLHLQGKEWEYVNEQTLVNAHRVQMLTDKAIALAKKQKETTTEKKKELSIYEQIYGEMTTGERQVHEAMKGVDEAHQNRLAALKEELGLYTKDDISDKLEQMVADYEDMKALGIDNVQLGSQFGDEMLEWLKLAKENNIALPYGVNKMADDLKGNVNPAVNKMVDNWVVLRNNINAMGKVIDGINWSKPGKEAEVALKGGFETGITQGLESGTVEFTRWVKRIEETPIYIKPQLDLEGWNQAVQDAIAGRIPDTTG
jgi:hypothetical protein